MKAKKVRSRSSGAGVGTSRRDGRLPVNVHFNEEEKALLKGVAEQLGMPLATWIRTTTLTIAKGIAKDKEGDT